MVKRKLQYVSDINGIIIAIQIPIRDWRRIIAKLKESEKILKYKSNSSISLK